MNYIRHGGSNDDSPSARRRKPHGTTQRLGRIARLFLVLAILCIIISGLFFIVAFRHGDHIRQNMLRLSLDYLGGGGVLLLGRVITIALRERRKKRHTFGPVSAEVSDRPARGTNGQQGMALVMVLILLGLVGVLITSAQVRAHHLLRSEQRALLESRLQQAAADAARAALRRLADDDDPGVDHLKKPWTEPREERDPTGIATRTVVTDENRRFDLNNLARAGQRSGMRPPEEILMDLFTLCGDFTPVGRVEALRDWVDADAEGSYEAPFYAERKPPCRVANRPLYGLSELLPIEGFSRSLFARHERRQLSSDSFQNDLADCVTVIPGVNRSAPIPLNVNTAEPAVLQGLLGFGRESAIRTLMTLRAVKPIRSLETLWAIAPDLAKTIGAYLDIRSSVFSVDVQSYAEGTTARLHVLAQRQQDGRMDVLEWVY